MKTQSKSEINEFLNIHAGGHRPPLTTDSDCKEMNDEYGRRVVASAAVHAVAPIKPALDDPDGHTPNPTKLAAFSRYIAGDGDRPPTITHAADAVKPLRPELPDGEPDVLATLRAIRTEANFSEDDGAFDLGESLIEIESLAGGALARVSELLAENATLRAALADIVRIGFTGDGSTALDQILAIGRAASDGR